MNTRFDVPIRHMSGGVADARFCYAEAAMGLLLPSPTPPADPSDPVADTASLLIALLHRGAGVEAFAGPLAQAEALPDAVAGKTGLVELVRMAMALRNRIELHEQRERGMLAVIESAQDLSSRRDLQGLLRAIVQRARNLMGAHLCWLSVMDTTTGEFRVVVADGAISQRTGRMTARRDRGVAGMVMASRLPFFTPDYLQDRRFVHDPALDETFRDEGVAALVGVPLIAEDAVIGLLFVADRYHRTHTALDVSILGTLATHAAVAIVNAEAFAQAHDALARADAARAELELHARDVQAAAEAHEQLTTLLARGASLDALCAAVARQLDGDILVLDAAGEVIGRAAAGATPGPAAAGYRPHGPYGTALSTALRESRQAGRSMRACDIDGACCRAIAVIGGNDVLGAVLVFRTEDLAGIALRTFERSASVIGLVLLSQEKAEAEKSRDASALMRALVAPRLGEAAPTARDAARFGLDLSQPVCVLVVDTLASTPAAWSRRLRADPALSDPFHDTVDGLLVLVCGATRMPALRSRIEEIARRAPDLQLRGIVSRPVPATGLPDSHAALRRALPVLGRLDARTGIVGQHEIALYAVLFETQDRTGLDVYLEASLGAVAAYDRRRGTALRATLLAYFDANQNATVAATRLGIHVNTMRQRLATAEELLGHWGSAHRALDLHMALRLWHLGGPETSASA